MNPAYLAFFRQCVAKLPTWGSWTVVLGTIVLLGLGWSEVYSRMKEAYADMRADTQRFVHIGTQNFTQYLEGALLLADQQAKIVNLEFKDKAPSSSFVVPSLDGMMVAYILDKKGNLVASSQTAPPFRDLFPDNNVDSIITHSKTPASFLLPVSQTNPVNRYLPVLWKNSELAYSVIFLLPETKLREKLTEAIPYFTAKISISHGQHVLMSITPELKKTMPLKDGERILAKAPAAISPYSIEGSIVAKEVLHALDVRGNLMYVRASIASLALGALAFMGLLSLRRLSDNEKKLQKLVETDSLTGLPNRYFFNQHLTTMVTQSEEEHHGFALFFIDLDNFKYVNDSLGHDAGDELLKGVTSRLRAAVRDRDVVCRLGGDEFTVLLPELTSIEETELIAQRVVDTMSAAFEVREVSVYAHASIGVALMGVHATSASELMRFADAAMYHAKQKGKNRYVVYQTSMTLQALAKEHRARDLQAAIGTEQFFLHYQPKVELTNGVVAGYEALLRWNHPIEGAISPAQFIPIAEDCGAIISLGQWVIEETVRQQRQWYEEGRGWKMIAVNVSALQLRSRRLPDIVKNILQRYDVSGAYLQMEITESLLVTDVEEAKETITRLRQMGVSIAVDDFGTGYSSLSTLQQFDINCLKVDRSFVMALDTDSGYNICLAIVNLAHSLGMRVVAEGIETVGQYSQLMELGCEEGQGFFFARPLPAEQAGKYAPNILLFPSPLAA